MCSFGAPVGIPTIVGIFLQGTFLLLVFSALDTFTVECVFLGSASLVCAMECKDWKSLPILFSCELALF